MHARAGRWLGYKQVALNHLPDGLQSLERRSIVQSGWDMGTALFTTLERDYWFMGCKG